MIVVIGVTTAIGKPDKGALGINGFGIEFKVPVLPLEPAVNIPPLCCRRRLFTAGVPLKHILELLTRPELL